MRKDNIIYYGSMADPYIVMMQVLETKTVGGEEIASKVSVQLQLTDPNVRSRDRVTKRSRKRRHLFCPGCGQHMARAGAECKLK